MKNYLQGNCRLSIGVACTAIMFLAGCGTLHSTQASAAPEMPSLITPIPPVPLPDFLWEVFPKPGTYLSLEEYNTPQKGLDRREGAAVCVTVDGVPLLEGGDDWYASDVVDRTSIEIDGAQREVIGYIEDYGVTHEIVTEASEGNLTVTATAKVRGPYRWCVAAPLSPGIHRADIRFEKSNGETVSFTWTFELTDGIVPTRTPLPKPSAVDQTGNLPEYLQAVYPPSGKTVSVAVSEIDRSEFAELWPSLTAYPTDSGEWPVCYALYGDELLALGLPWRYRSERVYLTVDDSLVDTWLHDGLPAGLRSVHMRCAVTTLESGEHVAALYIDPFDSDLVIYGWSFTIGER